MTNNSARERAEKISELKQEIAEICHLMRGPLDDFDRACYHLERKEMREELARLEAATQ